MKPKPYTCQSCGWVHHVARSRTQLARMKCSNCATGLQAEPRNVAVIIDRQNEGAGSRWGNAKTQRESRARMGGVQTFADGTAWG